MRDSEVEDKIDLDERSRRSTDTVGGQMRFWCCVLTSLICHCTELVGRRMVRIATTAGWLAGLAERVG